tara:strand:+ start:318 stop:566 length:249 start_codon:yes stop_codon:yes gene_type:complete
LKKKTIKSIWPNGRIINVNEGEDWFLVAKKAGIQIPSGCLTGSCGACEIDVNGKTVRACINQIKNSKETILKIEFLYDPAWE